MDSGQPLHNFQIDDGGFFNDLLERDWVQAPVIAPINFVKREIVPRMAPTVGKLESNMIRHVARAGDHRYHDAGFYLRDRPSESKCPREMLIIFRIIVARTACRIRHIAIHKNHY
jgi:hypothetical protein